ncbi:MAG: hypothetical protein FWG85_00670 [Bacteroidetes bacterium]|nr:hypothetical protein [Bacteroidota bacterium]
MLIYCNKPVDNGNPDIVGTFTWTEWQKKSGWKDHSASDYLPDSACVKTLSTFIDEHSNADIKFEIYASNWCHADCATQLPKIIKFLKEAGINENDIIIYGLNRTKAEPFDAMQKWENNFPNEVCRVPTLVIYFNNYVGKVKCESQDYPEWQCKIYDELMCANL